MNPTRFAATSGLVTISITLYGTLTQAQHDAGAALALYRARQLDVRLPFTLPRHLAAQM